MSKMSDSVNIEALHSIDQFRWLFSILPIVVQFESQHDDNLITSMIKQAVPGDDCKKQDYRKESRGSFRIIQII